MIVSSFYNPQYVRTVRNSWLRAMIFSLLPKDCGMGVQALMRAINDLMTREGYQERHHLNDRQLQAILRTNAEDAWQVIGGVVFRNPRYRGEMRNKKTLKARVFDQKTILPILDDLLHDGELTREKGSRKMDLNRATPLPSMAVAIKTASS